MNRKIKTLFTVAALIVLLPATGFPDSWKAFFSIIFGLTIAYIAYMYYQDDRRAVSHKVKPKPAGTEIFVENSGIKSTQDAPEPIEAD